MARPGLDRDVKFRRLIRILGEPRSHVRGYLECLWDVAYEHGRPFIGDADSVAAACDYPGDSAKIVDALLNCGGNGRHGFIEPAEGANGYQVHDLFDHAPEYVLNRASAERERSKVKKCAKCGSEYRSTDPRSSYCSHRCRQSSYRSRGASVTQSGASVTQSGAVVRHVTSCDGTPAPTPTPKEEEKYIAASPLVGPSSIQGNSSDENGSTEQASASNTPLQRDPLWDAIVEVTGTDASIRTKASHVGRVRKVLLKAKPPYSAEDVYRLREIAPSEMAWTAGRHLTLGEIEKNIGLVRAKGETRVPITTSVGRPGSIASGRVSAPPGTYANAGRNAPADKTSGSGEQTPADPFEGLG